MGMKDGEQTSSYSININNKKYSFACTDGEEHVRSIESKLDKTIKTVSGAEPAPVLSDYAIKMALLLADEIVSSQNSNQILLNEIEQKVAPMIDQLNNALGLD